ncbi:unnamed protein product [Urochloa humidicola]
MDAEYAALPADLENGGGSGAITIEMEPCPADRQLKEKHLFTWLGELPYTVAVVVGAVLFAVGLVMMAFIELAEHGHGQPQDMTTGEVWAVVLTGGGGTLAQLGLLAGADAGWCQPEDLLRLETD